MILRGCSSQVKTHARKRNSSDTAKTGPSGNRVPRARNALRPPLAPGEWTNDFFLKPIGKQAPLPGLKSTTVTATAPGAPAKTETRHALARPLSELFSYDPDGNLTQDGLYAYAYDGENRLKWVRHLVADENGHYKSLEFTYDYMGRRVAKEVWTYTGPAASPATRTFKTATRYLYQGWTLLAEYATGGAGATAATDLALIRRYTWGVDLSGTLGGAGDIGGLLAIEDLRPHYAGIFNPAYDGNGNLMALTETTTGNMAAAYEYDPFGNLLRSSGAYAKENPIRFSGKYYDHETGLSYHGFRYYNASTGRFANRDPLEERGGWTLYGSLHYSAGNPFAGVSGVEGTSWATEWEQAQDRRLENTSLPGTTQAVSFDSKKNSGIPGSSQTNMKNYSANATAHYAQGGAPGKGPRAPGMSGANPGAGNADMNLYAYAGNDPINSYDAMGLQAGGWSRFWGGLWGGFKSLFGFASAARSFATPRVQSPLSTPKTVTPQQTPSQQVKPAEAPNVAPDNVTNNVQMKQESNEDIMIRLAAERIYKNIGEVVAAQKKENPSTKLSDIVYVLNSTQLKTILDDGARMTKSKNIPNMTTEDFFGHLAGGDTPLRGFSSIQFALIDEHAGYAGTYFGGDINYFYQGMAHAARNNGLVVDTALRETSIIAHNLVQFADGEGVHNLKQIIRGNASLWANLGYHYFK